MELIIYSDSKDGSFEHCIVSPLVTTPVVHMNNNGIVGELLMVLPPKPNGSSTPLHAFKVDFVMALP